MIKVLEKQVADKIAAGEVVDRPLSIVKELVENSVDAGSKAITADIQKGGKTYIRISDDGKGIPSDETELAFKRHATSKIDKAEDLQSIMTLGFRGEALASIAAVSRVELVTKTKEEDMGCKICIEGSDIISKSSTGCPDGTTIIVKDLFYNTPARYKFMKSEKTESSLIIEFISQMALAYPHIKFRMISNGNMLFSTRGKGDVYQNILTIYSKTAGEALVPVAHTKDSMKLSGYISNPGVSRPNRRGQIYFVNGRVVKSKVMEKALSAGYERRLFEGRFPIAYLFLETDPHKLDVNIHPNKKEVRFDEEKVIEEFIIEGIKTALSAGEAVPQIRETNLGKASAFVKEKTAPYKSSLKKENNSFQGNKVGKTQKETQVDIKNILTTLRKEEKKKTEEIKKSDALVQKEELPPKTPPPMDFTVLKTVGTAFDTYVIVKDADTLYLIDQHAAHERIFFEKLLDEYRREDPHIQPIIMPIIIKTSATLSDTQTDWMDALKTMGFDIDVFGPGTYKIQGIPAFMDLSEAESFVNDYLDMADENDRFENPKAVAKIISKSCKNAVKAHDHLSELEVQALIKDLSDCSEPFSCPHGRPTFIKLTKKEIEKMFKRI